jgi:hypothetical protein
MVSNNDVCPYAALIETKAFTGWREHDATVRLPPMDEGVRLPARAEKRRRLAGAT